ncbi:MAG TPA: HAD hydrolase-like protein [Solirubrobacteraceae bacterium]|nr:HAD hydrolase-like protein [Solirubrobacteraceae bacterium]
MRAATRPESTVLFDLDGCLVDSFPSILRCWSETLPAFGFPVPDAETVRVHVGPPLAVSARRYAAGADEATLARIIASYRALATHAEDVVLFPGVRELLDTLQAREIVLGIATSKSIEVVEPLLERLALTQYFVVVEGTRVDELGTDKVTIVGRALAALAPRRAHMLVGDREHDVEGAHAHGLSAVGVLWGYGSAHELVRAGADATIAEPSELLSLLGLAPLGQSSATAAVAD